MGAFHSMSIICEHGHVQRRRFPEAEGGLLHLPREVGHSCLGDSPGSQPCACFSEQSEEDIDVAAFSQPENIANPMYESATSAPPEPSYDPFAVSLHFDLGKGSSWLQKNGIFQQSMADSCTQRLRVSSLLECASVCEPESQLCKLLKTVGPGGQVVGAHVGAEEN